MVIESKEKYYYFLNLLKFNEGNQVKTSLLLQIQRNNIEN